MNKEIPSFQQYQLAFTQHLRDPKNFGRPSGVTKGIAIYEEIVFNNIFESVSACFPVAQKVLGESAWLQLSRDFLREYSANSPIFRQIPQEFLSYISTRQNLPPYFYSLCHYEWVELAVSMIDLTIDQNLIDHTGDLLQQKIVLNPALQLLDYDYDVQNISSQYKPKTQVSTQLLVYRNIEDIVKFVELNSVTYRLVLLLQGGMTGKEALMLISQELGHAEPESVVQFGLEMLEDFKRQGIVLGVQKTKDQVRIA